MFTTIRKHQRWLMLVIAFLTIVAFAFLYNTTDLERVGTNIVARIYGRDVMQVDVERALRNYQLALALGQFNLVRDLAGQARSEDEAAENFIWNLMVLQHQAAALGVEPGLEAVVDRIKTVPVFQTAKAFDPVKYSAFMQEQLAPRGFTERQLEGVIRDALRLEGIKSLVESPAMLLKDGTKPVLARMAPVDLVVIRFDAAAADPVTDEDGAKTKERGKGKAGSKDKNAGKAKGEEKEGDKAPEVSDEDLRQAFAERTNSLQAPEKRSVRYTAFVMSPSEKDLKDKARIEVLQRLSSATGEFAQTLADGGQSLADTALAKNLKVQTTPLFAKDGTASGALAGLDGELVPAAAAVAFRLPAAGGVEIVQLGEDGYAVIEVAEVQEARPLTFEEARADLRAQLIAARREQAVRESADRALANIREQMAAGKPFAEAAKAAGVKTETINGLSIFAGDLTPERRELAMSVMDQPVGALTAFVPKPGGGFAAYVAARGEPDAAVLAEHLPMIEQGLLQEKKMLLFAQWLAASRQSSDLQILRPAR